MRMEGYRRLIMLALSLAATGCLQPSLQPLVADGEGISDARLDGTWRCGAETWTFAAQARKDGSTDYDVELLSEGLTHSFTARLGRFGDRLFVDFWPEDIEPDPGPDVNGFFGWHVVLAHTFGRLEFVDDRLELRMLDSDWTRRLIDATGGTLGQRTRDTWVLTAATPDLQRIARAFADDKAAFPAQAVLVRAPEDPSTGTCYDD